MGVYSGVLSPPSAGFWFVLVVGMLMSFVPIISTLVSNYSAKRRDSRGPLTIGIFSALSTLLLIHLFGDSQVLGWLYETPDRSSGTGFQALIMPFGPVFWLLVMGEVILSFMALRYRNGGWATISLIATLFLVQFVTGVPVFPWMVQHYWGAVGAVTLWLLVGVIWSFFYKWDDLVCKIRTAYDAVRAGWLKGKGLTESSDFMLQDKEEWEYYFKTHNTTDDRDVIEHRPKFRNHKSELLGWATLWPLSMFETFLFDWLSQVVNRLYLRFGGVLEWIMARRWKGTEGHMLSDEEREILEREKSQKRK